jgi:hypothetical protein
VTIPRSLPRDKTSVADDPPKLRTYPARPSDHCYLLSAICYLDISSTNILPLRPIPSSVTLYLRLLLLFRLLF